MGLFSIIGTVGRALFGSGKEGTTTNTTKADFEKQLKLQREEYEKQMTAQAQESKKMMTTIGIAAGILMVMMFMFMRK